MFWFSLSSASLPLSAAASIAALALLATALALRARRIEPSGSRLRTQSYLRRFLLDPHMSASVAQPFQYRASSGTFCFACQWNALALSESFRVIRRLTD